MPATALLTAGQYLALPDQYDKLAIAVISPVNTDPLLRGFSTPVSTNFDLT
jgi:hypothetical protein